MCISTALSTWFGYKQGGLLELGPAGAEEFGSGAERRFHLVTSAITIVAGISYYSMAIGVGWIQLQSCRWFAWARYVDWLITTPLLLLDLILLARIDTNRTGLLVFLDVVMIVTGFLGSVTESKARWGYYAIGCVCFIGMLSELLGPVRRAAWREDPPIGKLFDQLNFWTVALWTAYPIVWILSEGLNVVGDGTEIVLYGILDVLAKCFFGFWLLYKHDEISRGILEFGDY
jgi:bacteriorhodopsin